MTIPLSSAPWHGADQDGAWATLTAEGKRERILRAAWQLFSEDGLDAPMPKVAAAAGAGVGSLYRQFPSKRDLLAAIVERRLEQVHQAALAANRQPGSRWEALTGMLWTTVEQQHGDEILGAAWSQVSDEPDVAEATLRTQAALDELLESGRREGSVRADADNNDIRLIYAASRASKHVGPEAWRRMLELLIDGLAAR